MSKAYKNGGLKVFYRGLMPRTTRVGLALWVMGAVKVGLSDVLNKVES